MLTLTQPQADRLWRQQVEYFVLGCTPVEERCTQAGENPGAQLLECQALAGQLIRMYGKHPKADLFILRQFHEEGGLYHELCVMFEEDNEEAQDYANNCENLPEQWDGIAMEWLGEQEHPFFSTPVIPINRKSA